MRGIIAWGGYVPYHRLDREVIAAAHGGMPGSARGSRAVASYDEDTTTMGVEAARIAMGGSRKAARETVSALWFATSEPAYIDKTNATTLHAALRLPRDSAAYDMVGSVRCSAGALRAALSGSGTSLIVASDTRTGLPNSADERDGGDGAGVLLIGQESESSGLPLIAEYLGGSSTSEEFIDRWRAPGDQHSKQWEERFGETRYVSLAIEAWKLAVDQAGIDPAEINDVVVVGPNTRAVKQACRKMAIANAADDLVATVGNTGAAHGLLCIANVLDRAEPGQVIALVSLADGCDVFLFRTTDAIASHKPRSVASQIAEGRVGLAYAKFLSWTGMIILQPPNRPEPTRSSASAAARSGDWKFGFVGSKDRSSGAIHLPPSRVSVLGGTVDDMDSVPMSDVKGTIATFTVDQLAYSPSPPVVFAVVDFDGGGRYPIELTDIDADDVSIGDRVEMTFRRLSEADGIKNYFWKARRVLEDQA